MYVTEGAHEKLLASEREHFMHDEWPATVTRIHQLGLDVKLLLEEDDVDS